MEHLEGDGEVAKADTSGVSDVFRTQGCWIELERLMKQVIDGRTYNTETAIFLADAQGGGQGRSDFRYWEESLYKTRKGAFFIDGSGGPLTHWSRKCGNETSGGRGIRVLTEAEARVWVEEHANEKYEEIFGAAEEA
jgi:hypothetical protein